MSAQSVGILTSPGLLDCASNWISLGSRISILKLELLDRSLGLLQIYAPDSISKYQAFVDKLTMLLSVYCLRIL